MPHPDSFDLPRSQEPAMPDSIVDLRSIIHLLLTKSWLIIACVILALLIAVAYVKKAPRIYEAVTTVQVQQEDAKIVKSDQVVTEDLRGLDILNTVAEKLRNAALLEQVLVTNNLLQPGSAFATNGPEALARDEVIGRFASNVKASLRHDTRLIDIAVRNADPNLAARLANSLVENYLDQDAQAQFTATEAANKFLEHAAERQKEKLEASERALQDYRRKMGSVSLEQSQDIITPQLLDLSKRMTQTEVALIQARGQYENSLQMGTNIESLLAYPQIANDPDVMEISTDVARHENDFVLIRQRYREKNPKYIVAAASLDGLKQQMALTVQKVRARIQESLRIAYQDALTSQQGLQQELVNTESNAMQLSDAAVFFNVLSREVESDKAQYDALISRLGETRVEALINPERIRVVQPASVPGIPTYPKSKLIFVLSIFAGLGVGLGLSFLLESFNSSIRTVDEAERYLALPVLASIPKLSKTEVKDNVLATVTNHKSGKSETFRTLRTTLSLLGREEERKTFLFTSALPDEGKTFISINYAVSLAQQGLRTLLVDMDLRRPMLEKSFTGKRGVLPGVTDFFLGQKKLSELCLNHKDVSNLLWIPAGSFVPNPIELLSRSDFRQLLVEGVADFDRIVIDTAPVLPVSDALLLANKVQTVVLVVKDSKTPRSAVQRSMKMLKKVNAPLGGIVLNFFPNRLFAGHYHYLYDQYNHVQEEPLHSK
jgi:succinoglycan biosynthesis transport protein ExoP